MHVALQHSLEREHPCPLDRQVSSAQMPAAQDWLQQSLYAEHEEPPARHFPAGTLVLPPEEPPADPSPAKVPPFVPLPAHPSAAAATRPTATRKIPTVHARR